MWAKPPLRWCRAWRGATRPTVANRLCTCTSVPGQTQTQTQTLASHVDAWAAQDRAVGKGCELWESTLHQRA